MATAPRRCPRNSCKQHLSRTATGPNGVDLRHSYATWLVDDGVAVNIVQRVMGHERSSTRLDLYTYRSDGEDRILQALGADRDNDEEPW